MSTEMKHDPEFPYVVTAGGGKRMARFGEKWHADNYVRNCGGPSWLVTDTTPAPKIPEDAEFITWDKGSAYSVGIASKDQHGDWWVDRQCYPLDGPLGLLNKIGNAKVTVLDKRSN